MDMSMQKIKTTTASAPVDDVLTGQTAIISELKNSIERLEHRASPVMGAEYAEPGPVNGESPQDTSSRSTVYNVIRENNDSLSILIYRINRIIERIEV